jgi:general secretion pathway protein D
MNNWIRKTNAIALMCVLLLGGTSQNVIGQDADPSQAAAVSSGDDTVRILWRAEKLVSVLHYLEILTERSVIRPQSLPTPEFTFDSRGDMTRDEAILAIESLLSINGIGVTPLGDKLLKVVAIASIRTEAPELEIGSLKDRAPSGKVVSKLFRLKYLDSQTFQTQIQQFLSPGFSTIIPFQNSNAVIVTDTISNLQRLEYVVSEVDTPSRLNVETRFYTLEFAQASEVSQQIQGLIDAARTNFGENNNQNSNTNNNRAQARTQGGGVNQAARLQPAIAAVAAEGAIPNQILFGSNTALASDDRTNQIIIMSEPSNMVFFDDIIEKLDIKADPATRIEVIVLNHAEATEVAGLLSSFVSGSTSTESGDRSQAGANTGRQQTNTGQQGAAQNTIRQNAQTQPRQQQVANAVRTVLEDRDSQFSDFMTIEADERSNALIISGTRSDLELMTELIAKIDVLLPQVLIEVIIAEVNLGNDANRGTSSISGSYVQNEAEGEPNITGLNGLDLFGIGASNVALNLDKTTGIISNLSFDAILNAARTNSNVRILSKPYLMTTHNKEATFTVGQRVPVVTGTVSDSLNGNRETVQYQDIAIELKVKPLIGPNDIIQMEIDQSVNDIDREVLVNGNEQPVIGSRQMVSFVSVKSNGLVVLGGMQRSKQSDTKGRMAILGEIPLLGNLFRSKAVGFENRELLLFIRPKVVRDADEANANARDAIGKHPISGKVDDLLEKGEFDLRTKDKKKSKPEESNGEPSSVSRKRFKR